MEAVKGGKEMKKDRVLLAEFVQGDRFELNCYLTSLFIKGRSLKIKQ